MNKIAKTVIASFIATSLLGATAVRAQDREQTGQSASGDMQGMMGMMGMMDQMTRMMTNCNNMMETTMNKGDGSGHPNGENGPSQPGDNG